jgi:hypothetical protein
MDQEIDYRQLLKKYIGLILDIEGVHFINEAQSPDFTEKEINALLKLYDEL